MLKTPYNQLSGFEDEALNDFAQEGFKEALESDAAVDIELCNYDLSSNTKMRAIVQNNVQDTKLKTLTRELFVPIGTCHAGMYVKYKRRYWLIVGLVDDNKMYEKAVLVLCNYLLTWLNNDKKIIQRWANIISASQYNNGETGSKFYNLRSDQLLISIPDDDESMLLTSGQRFIIDMRCKIYEKNIQHDSICDTSNPVITYAITRTDSVLYHYQDSGYFEFMVTQDEQHKEDGYYFVDGDGYWLCGKKESTDFDKSIVLSSRIECDSQVIYNGIEPGIFTAKFYDTEGNEVSITPQWNIDCNFVDELEIEYVNNSICIAANNKKLINKSFELFLNADNYEQTSMIITIRAFI